MTADRRAAAACSLTLRANEAASGTVVRSEGEAAWHRLCGAPDQGDLSSLARRAQDPPDRLCSLQQAARP